MGERVSMSTRFTFPPTEKRPLRARKLLIRHDTMAGRGVSSCPPPAPEARGNDGEFPSPIRLSPLRSGVPDRAACKHHRQYENEG